MQALRRAGGERRQHLSLVREAVPHGLLEVPQVPLPIQTGQRACAHCGLELKLDCPSCGKPTFLGDFCESCGARLLAKCPRCGAEQVPLGERCASCDKKIKGGWKI